MRVPTKLDFKGQKLKIISREGVDEVKKMMNTLFETLVRFLELFKQDGNGKSMTKLKSILLIHSKQGA